MEPGSGIGNGKEGMRQTYLEGKQEVKGNVRTL